MSDQGREFVNKVNQELFKLCGTDHRNSSAYHPQTNGLDERMNQTQTTALVKFVNENQDDWDVHIKSVLFAYRTCKKGSTKLGLLFINRWICAGVRQRVSEKPDLIDESPVERMLQVPSYGQETCSRTASSTNPAGRSRLWALRPCLRL